MALESTTKFWALRNSEITIEITTSHSIIQGHFPDGNQNNACKPTMARQLILILQMAIPRWFSLKTLSSTFALVEQQTS